MPNGNFGQMLAKYRNVGVKTSKNKIAIFMKTKNWLKAEVQIKIEILGEKQNFWSKANVFFRKQKFWSKIANLVKIRSLGQK